MMTTRVRAAMKLAGLTHLPKLVRGRLIWMDIDRVSLRPWKLHSKEGPFFKFLLSRIRSSDTVLDIGAHYGLFTVPAAAVADRVVSFEPDPENRAQLLESIRRNSLSNVDVRDVAVSGKVGSASLFMAEHGASSIVEGTGRSVTVDTTTLDDLGLPADVIKIDAEGAEEAVLAAGQRTLGNTRLLAIEVHTFRGVSDSDLAPYLRGFREVFRYEAPWSSGDHSHQVIWER